MKTRKAIGIAGVARSGKDSTGKVVVDFLRRNGVNASRFAFADALKSDLIQLTAPMGLWPFTTRDEEKDILRPLLVAYGCAWRAVEPLHWVEALSRVSLDVLPVVTDVRFKNEAEAIQDGGGVVFHITRHLPDGSVLPPPNEEEARNDPEVSDIANVNLATASFGPEDMDTLFTELVEASIGPALLPLIAQLKEEYPLNE